MAYKSELEKRAEWQAIREGISILDLAQEYGKTPVRVGYYYSLKEHDSVRIDPRKNIFIRNSRPDARGSCIDFALEFGNYENIHEVLADFSNRIEGYVDNPALEKQVPKKEDVPKKRKSGEIVLPPHDGNVKNVFAYLTSSRKIDKSIVSEFIADKRLYQDTHKNCVFVGRNDAGKVVYAGLRGTNTYKRFMGDVTGSDYSHCFYVNNNAASMVVTEAVIDTMSHMTFDRHLGFKDKKINYLALSSANKYEAIATHLKEHPEINRIYLAFDDDVAGHKFCEKSKELIKQIGWDGEVIEDYPQLGHDWNAQLCYCVENGIRYDFYLPDPDTRQLLENYCSSKYECFIYRKDARAYTKAKKQKDELMVQLMDKDLPSAFLDYTDMYYQNADTLQNGEHDPVKAVEEIVDHFNKKNKDFSDIGFQGFENQDKMMQRLRMERFRNETSVDHSAECGIGG